MGFLNNTGLERLWTHIITKISESLATSKTYADEKVDAITSGSVTVAEAEHATTADSATTATNATNANHATSADTATSATSATKATQDASGNVITSTYETKSDASAKLTEAKTYTDTVASGKADSTHNHDSAYDTKGAANTAETNAKAYTDTHNTSTTAHGDIRTLISDLSTKVNNFLDVDDTTTDELSEVLALINNNKGTLESLTSTKVNVSDIIDNLETAVATKVLSANQGVELKKLIDALQSVVDGKADEGHGHAIANVSGLQDALDGKSATGHKHVVADITDLTATATELNYMKGVTSGVQGQLNSKATQTSLDTHTSNTTVHITADERTNWNAIEGNANTYTDQQVSAVSGNLTTHANNTDIHFSATERIKLSGIQEGANLTVVDTALSSTSTNPVENQAVNTAIVGLTETISLNTQSISAHTTSINNIQAELDSFQEITSQEIQNLFNA